MPFPTVYPTRNGRRDRSFDVAAIDREEQSFLIKTKQTRSIDLLF